MDTPNNTQDILESTHFTHMGVRKMGKVRDIYTQEHRVVLVSTDRHSSFDRIIAHIPHKGQVLNQISAFWFENTKDIVQNHLIAVPDPNVVVVKRCIPLPVEVVMRGYITGVTDTSLWTQYEKGQRDFGNFTLPEGMLKNQKLQQAVLTPTTKSDEHDRAITPQEIIESGLVEEKLWEEVAAKAAALFARGQEIAECSGLILVDTKYEFGIDENGVLTLIDEIHTPDSSRYWQKNSYDQRMQAGKDPEFFDKEFLRIWFKEHCDPYADAMLPPAPPEMVTELSRRYMQIFEQITGAPLSIPASTMAIAQRIEIALTSYHVD